jgi:uncharacterized protein YjbJ (UPF0337 family)
VPSSTDVSSTTKQEAGKLADTATGQTRDVAATAKGAVTEVAGTAREQAGEVVNTATSHAQDLLGQAKDAFGTESDELVKRLAVNIRRLAGDLANMADLKGTPGSPANTIVSEVGERAGGLASLLESRGTQGLIAEAQSYARRRPGVFLLGAAGAGLFAGRLTRALKAGPPPTSTSTPTSTTDTAALNLPPTTGPLDPSIARP